MEPYVPPWIESTTIVVSLLTAIVIGIGFVRRAQSTPSPRPATPAWPLIGSAALALWLLAAFILGSQGFFRSTPSNRFPTIILAFIPLVAGYALLLLSRSFRAIVTSTPLAWLIGVQFFRTFGLVFVILYAGGNLPGVFALPAGIGDGLIGITAPIVAYLLLTQHSWARPAAVLWNIAGIVDLVVAMTLGFLSSPGPFQLLARDAPNVLVTAFPLVLVPTFAVPLFLLLHVFSLHKLRNRAFGDRIQTGSRPAHV
jgi:hypothetical protein